MSVIGSTGSAKYAEGTRLLGQGNAQGAIRAFEEALKASPNHVDALLGIAEAKMQFASNAEARAYLTKAASVMPSNERVHVTLGLNYAAEGQFEQAHASVDRALGLKPESPMAVRAKAELLRMEGRYEEAHALLAPVVERGERDAVLLMTYARVSHRFEGADRAIEVVRGIVDDEASDNRTRMQAAFQLAEMLDRAGRYDEAFASATLANSLRGQRFDLAEQERVFEEYCANWTEDAAAAIPDSGEKSEMPVFVVGMPRSGTTLVERIIGAHPDAFPGGERHEVASVGRELVRASGNFMHDPSVLGSANLRKHARVVARKLKGAAPVKVERVVDKMPTNYVRLNLIAKLFPNASYIHTVRDPRDTCLSCYFHSFAGAHPYAYDLSDLGGYYRLYKKMTDHFIGVLNLDVLEVPYEEVVDDQEAWSRRIIDHVGLEWDDACLRFYEASGTSVTVSNEQVRQPIYTSSVGRWKNYEKHLGPLVEALGDLV